MFKLTTPLSFYKCRRLNVSNSGHSSGWKSGIIVTETIGVQDP